jgi:RNA polymerase sigma-70 factor (ECF subfamily)
MSDTIMPSALCAAAPRESELEREVAILFERLRTPVLRYLLSMRVGAADAEEVVQETFMALFRHLGQGKSRANLQAWIFKVAHNVALKNRSRMQRESEALSEDHADCAPGPEERAAALQRQRRLLAVVRALPEQDQWCLSLRAEGLRYREIAEVIGISLGSVANSLERSLARLSRADQCRVTYVA